MLWMIPAGVQLATGIYQTIKGQQMGNAATPEFKIPEAAKNALEIARGMAMQKELPGQSIIEDKLRASTASGINAIGQTTLGGNSLGAMVDIMGNEQGKIRDLGIDAARNYNSNQIHYENALNTMSNWEKAKYDFEVIKPFQEKMRAATMLKEGGLQNIMGATSSGIQNYLGSKSNDRYMSMMEKYYDKQSGGGNTNQNPYGGNDTQGKQKMSLEEFQKYFFKNTGNVDFNYKGGYPFIGNPLTPKI